MEYGWNILWFIVGIGLLVTVHEFGHFWVARKLGFKVLRFSIGFGKPLFKRVGRAPDHTEYVVAAIPLGGYVRMLDGRDGAISPEDLPRAFESKPPWKRILVMLAGPGANFLFAVLLLWAIFWVDGVLQVKAVIGTVQVDSRAAAAGLRSGDEIRSINGDAINDQGEAVLALVDAISSNGAAQMRVSTRDGVERAVTIDVADKDTRFNLTKPGKLPSGLGFEFWRPTAPALISAVVSDGPGAKAGLRPGDTIVSTNGVAVRSWGEFRSFISARPGEEVLLTVRRAGSETSLRVTPRRDVVEGQPIGRLMIEGPRDLEAYIPAEYKTRADLGPGGALAASVSKAWQMTVAQAKFFWRMVTFKVSTDNLSSVFTIADIAGETASAGPGSFFMLLVLLSLSLGFLNLLPIPLLDGGQVVFQLAEWIKGRPLSDRTYMLSQQVGLAAIVLLMGFALFNDLSNYLPALIK